MHKHINIHKDRFAVVGLGDTGKSIINYLHFEGAHLVSLFDTRSKLPKDFVNTHDLPLYLGNLKADLFADVDVIVVSPGVSAIHDEALQIAKTQGKCVIGDIELFTHAIKSWDCKIIGITGSNGKTTVTTLCGYLANQIGIKTLVCGNIGLPVLDSYIEIVASKCEKPKLIVLELSSFQLESLYSLKLDAATVLNISEDHLDRYNDVLEYAYSKSHIFNNCKNQILNKDDVLVMAMARSNLPHIYFALDGQNAAYGLSADRQYLQVQGKNYLETAKLSVVGMHNHLNVAAGMALLAAVGIDIFSKAFIDALTKFEGLEHRMQKIANHNGVLYIEDSKGTNVGAVVAGVSGLTQMVHLILGGDGKGQDFSPLYALVKNKCKSVAIIGQDQDLIANVLGGLSIPIKKFKTLQEAVKFCINNAQTGDAVVLSPACASWDMFDNYKHRAQVFKDTVNESFR